HIENVIQKYLRTEFATIEDYNLKAGDIAEPYRILVILDFPENLGETAFRRLLGIVQNGARCGVYCVIVEKIWPQTKQRLYGADLGALRRALIRIVAHGSTLKYDLKPFDAWNLTLAEPPSNEGAERIIKRIGPLAKEAMTVEVPYRKLL